MTNYKKTFVFLTILISFLMVSAVMAQDIKSPEIVDGRFIILMKSGKGVPADLDTAVSEAGGEILTRMPEIGVAVASSEADDFAKKVTKEKDVMAVVPDLRMNWTPPDEIYSQSVTPGDETLYVHQWNMWAIDAEGAWDAGYTGEGVRVAVLDSGIDKNHPDLSSNIDTVNSRSFVPSYFYDCFWDSDPAGHGTHVAGIIAVEDNGLGVIGVAPEATIIVVKVLTYFPGSGASGDFTWIVSGIYYAASLNADIINLSLGGYICKSGIKGSYSASEAAYYILLFQRVLNFAERCGVTVICAAGNDAINFNHSMQWIVLPAEGLTALAVSATGPQGRAYGNEDYDIPAIYTNFGSSLIDVAAPGGDLTLYYDNIPGYWMDWVLSTYPGGWAWGPGTSMAAPHVSGVAALIREKYGEISPGLMRAIIEITADDLGKPGVDDFYGKGRINAYNAVSGFALASLSEDIISEETRDISIGDMAVFTVNSPQLIESTSLRYKLDENSLLPDIGDPLLYKGNTGRQAVVTPPWSQSGNYGPPWYKSDLTWFKHEFSGPWWWQAPLGVSLVGPMWYQDGLTGPSWYQTLTNGPWWASMLP